MTITSSMTKPFRVRIAGLIDVVLVSDAEQIKWLNAHPDLERQIDPQASWLHRVVDRRLRTDLGFDGQLLPIFHARANPERARQRHELEERLEDLRGLPGEERQQIADYVSGQKHVGEIGVVVQQWCGRLFFPSYRSSPETYEAGRLLANWPVAPPWRAWRDRVSGRLDRSKSDLAAAAEGNLHCVHGTSIGMENVARSVRKLRKAAQSPDKQRLSPDDILRECVAAPIAVLRTCTTEVQAPFLKRPLTKRTVVVFLVARAYAKSGDLDVAFLGEDWSACPARTVISEMLRGVWHAAHHDETEHKRLLAKINGWSRLFSRAVS